MGSTFQVRRSGFVSPVGTRSSAIRRRMYHRRPACAGYQRYSLKGRAKVEQASLPVFPWVGGDPWARLNVASVSVVMVRRDVATDRAAQAECLRYAGPKVSQAFRLCYQTCAGVMYKTFDCR